MTLVRSVKARTVYLYCSIVFNSSSVCLLRHLVALGAFRRNHSIALVFRGFCCGLFRGPFARGFLHWEVFDDRDESCDLGSCDGCDGRCGSGCCDECDGCDAS